MTVYSVVYYDPRSEGNAGDCTHIAHFRNRRKAEEFAKNKTCYGQPATVNSQDVPARVASRWCFVG